MSEKLKKYSKNNLKKQLYRIDALNDGQNINQPRKRNILLWSETQTLKFTIFLDFHQNNHQKNKPKFIKQLSQFLQTKNQQQCSKYYQNVLQKTINVKQYIKESKILLGETYYEQLMTQYIPLILKFSSFNDKHQTKPVYQHNISHSNQTIISSQQITRKRLQATLNSSFHFQKWLQYVTELEKRKYWQFNSLNNFRYINGI